MSDSAGMVMGIDTVSNLFGMAHGLEACGIRFALKYTRPTSQFPHKAWTAAEIAGMRAVGIRRGYLLESAADISAFHPGTTAAVVEHILSKFSADSVPKGGACIAAVDFDALPSQDLTIIAWFTVVHAALKQYGFLLGAYASGRLLRKMTEAGIICLSMLPQSEGWDGNSDWLPHADIVQTLLRAPLGLNADICHATPRALEFMC